MTSNISSSTTGHAYRLRPMPVSSLSTNSSSTGSSSNTNVNSNSNSSYYGSPSSSSSSSAAPIVAAPTWSYSSPSQLARKYANITPIWCHITKPRQLKKKFASTFHPAQSLANFYNEDRAPSERRGSLNQTPQQQQQQQNQSSQSQQQQQPIVHTTNPTPHHYHHYDSSSYRQPYSSHYIPYDHGTEPSVPTTPSSSSSSSSRAKKKYTGGALTMHISSARLQSPPPPTPPISVPAEEKFSNPGERKARIDQLKDLVFNTRVKDSMIGRSDSRNRSTTNLHKANSYKRIDQITNPVDDYQPSVIPPTTPTRKDSHYYHYHLPSNTIASIVNENINRPIVPAPPPPPPAPTVTPATNSTTSQPSYNYDYLRAKSKERPRPTYYESNYITNQIRPTEIPPSTSSQIGTTSNSSYVSSATPTTSTNPSSSYRTYDDHGYVGKPTSLLDKNSSYTSITSYPSYQTPGSSKRRIKKYLLAKGTSSSGLSHQTEPIVTNMDNLSLHDEENVTNGDSSSVVIANTHAVTPPSPSRTSPSNLKTTTETANTTVVPSLDSTPPIPLLPTLSPSPSPSPVAMPSSVSVNNTAAATAESAVFSTPDAPLSLSPQNNYTNNQIPPVIVVPLSASLTSLNNQPAAIRSTTNSLLELVPLHRDKEQSPSRSIVPAVVEDGCESSVCVCLFAFLEREKLIAVLLLLPMFEIEIFFIYTHIHFIFPLIFACFNLLHVFAVLQHHLAIMYKLVHQLNVIVGDDTIDMTHRRIDVVVMAPVEILEPKVLQVHLQHPNDTRKRIMQQIITQIALIIIIIITNDQPRHPIKK